MSQQESERSSIKCNLRQAFSPGSGKFSSSSIHKFPDWSILWLSSNGCSRKMRNRLLLQCTFPFIEFRRRTSVVERTFTTEGNLSQCLEKYRAKNPLAHTLFVTSNWSRGLSYHTLSTCCIQLLGHSSLYIAP